RAAMWAYTTDDELATAMLGTWGAFWLGYGLLNSTSSIGPLLDRHAASPEWAYWFIPLAAITWMGAAAATMVNRALVTVLTLLAAASTLAAIGDGFGLHGVAMVAAWVFIIASICAWYTSTAMMLEESFMHELLPLGAAQRPMSDRMTGPHD